MNALKILLLLNNLVAEDKSESIYELKLKILKFVSVQTDLINENNSQK